ncbi:hypothetical protein HYH03_001731 [Edaphochlamys debaryana]|uniref:AAA+ ATPase domain-containing protein n=1 Tax=Edaphochlamys debaryana TaxID=47281 RepID=A0A835YM06_9CHLO|nr:hypothetical protein HYH03_001731 [Edaphochlamys debaryana]|eukprot:KAG2500149.1 hypothetical protein HYH03_001731 [Edaphochlamys debaryana]
MVARALLKAFAADGKCHPEEGLYSRSLEVVLEDFKSAAGTSKKVNKFRSLLQNSGLFKATGRRQAAQLAFTGPPSLVYGLYDMSPDVLYNRIIRGENLAAALATAGAGGSAAGPAAGAAAGTGGASGAAGGVRDGSVGSLEEGEEEGTIGTGESSEWEEWVEEEPGLAVAGGAGLLPAADAAAAGPGGSGLGAATAGDPGYTGGDPAYSGGAVGLGLGLPHGGQAPEAMEVDAEAPGRGADEAGQGAAAQPAAAAAEAAPAEAAAAAAAAQGAGGSGVGSLGDGQALAGQWVPPPPVPARVKAEQCPSETPVAVTAPPPPAPSDQAAAAAAPPAVAPAAAAAVPPAQTAAGAAASSSPAPAPAPAALAPGCASLDEGQRRVAAAVARDLLQAFAAAGRRHPDGALFGLTPSRLGAAYMAVAGRPSPYNLTRLLVGCGLFREQQAAGPEGEAELVLAAPEGLPYSLYDMNAEELYERILGGGDTTTAASPSGQGPRPIPLEARGGAGSAGPLDRPSFSPPVWQPPALRGAGGGSMAGLPSLPLPTAAAPADPMARVLPTGRRAAARRLAAAPSGLTRRAGLGPTAAPGSERSVRSAAHAPGIIPLVPPPPPAAPAPPPVPLHQTLRLSVGRDGRGRAALLGLAAAAGSAALAGTAAAAEPAEARPAEAGPAEAGPAEAGPAEASHSHGDADGDGDRPMAEAGTEAGPEEGGGGGDRGGSGAPADADLDCFLRLLPPELGQEVRRCALGAPAAGAPAHAAPSGGAASAPASVPGTPGAAHACSSPPPLLVDLAADAGRDVRLAFSDGSKRTLEGVKVHMGLALEQLASLVRALAEASAAGQGAEAVGGGAEEAQNPGDGAGRKRCFACGAQVEAGAEADGDMQGYGAQGAGPGPSVKRPRLTTAPSDLRLFGPDNRCCPPGTLHRVSAMRDPRSGRVIGLTYRVGRHLPGVAGPLADVLADLAGRGRAWTPEQAQAAGGVAESSGAARGKTARKLTGSLLLLGRPGSGKTTLLRDIAAHLSDGLGLGVVVVDTSNEIAGGDALPHACIGSARRLMVGPRHRLAEVMVEAVQNHTPEVIVVDEIANAEEVEAARTISARGVMLVATAHGTGLHSLMENKQLNGLVGGLQTVTLGDFAAQRSKSGAKTRTERSAQPVFRTLVEVMGGGRLLLRPDVASSVDAILGASPSSQQWQQGQGQGPRGPQQRHPRSQLPLRLSNPTPPLGHVASPSSLPPHQRPGSLLLHRGSSAAGEAGGSAGGAAEPLPPLEQLRWTEPGEGALKEGEEHADEGGWGGSKGRLRVQLLQLGAEAPEEEEG